MTTRTLGDVSSRTERRGVTAAYAAQGLSYATVVTALPFFKNRYGIDDDVVALITLTVVVGAACGSVLADRVAVRWGSRMSLILALSAQAIALAGVLVAQPFPLFWVFFGVYGLGLGGADASAAMQAVLVQRLIGRSVMGSFFATATVAAACGAVLMSGASGSSLGASLALGVAATVAAAVALVGTRILDRTREARATTPAQRAARAPIPALGLVLIGFVVFAAFAADSTLSTWTTLYLQDELALTGTVAVLGVAFMIAPLGYGIYQATTLATRLASDVVVRRWGRAPLAGGALAVGASGLATMAAVPTVAAVFVGLALAGLGIGVLAPLAFSAAGDLEPSRSDEIVARVNLFNYPGSVIGAVAPGLVAATVGYGPSFLVAASLLAAALVAVPQLRALPRRDGSRAAAVEPASERAPAD
ncbi:MFS transporter [Demequina capsici]|uniref:MFS transporter n=1 Tax=Demequina capsici TaxID=3075620 RepID=A0AA96FFX2_9MICO|nr:MFS transporter [Demequina sp. PMTSA13]WNM28729.1 MFS transporter [Demequina sp. PMTSA13]